MKTATPHFADAFSPFEPATAQPHGVAQLAAWLRQSMARTGQRRRPSDPESARHAYLAEASDAADLERRAQAWDSAQAVWRLLPPAL
ncbi:hypothetical protein [Pseudorhodoferax soli]|uniref:Uncharacterized protein n=1 Tax=Pseudorhodoferax soli TaxID=545864 RepID=A0A368XVX2_9BURK|nr:hypothetical protein [Pseudorhodoferax soli]RCW71208.1 hypothetical protein DES41_10427 [Pseudorhodoferax soli]